MSRLKFGAGIASVTVVAMLAVLLLTATFLPMAAGWKRVVLTSDSMTPLIQPGAVVLAKKDVSHPVAVGAVLVFTTPDGPGLITHRVVEVLPDGYRTKGDANTVTDVAPVTHDKVVGQGVLLVPFVGTPALWVQQGHPERAAAAVLIGLLLAALSRFGLLAKYDPWLAPASPRSAPASPRPAPASRRRSRLRPALAGATGGLLVGALVVTGISLVPQLSRGAFTATTDSSGNSVATAAVINTFFLKTNSTGNTTSSPVLPLSTSAPALTTLYNYDTNRDAAAGLLLAKSAGLNETDPTKIQRWNYTTPSSLTMRGTATLTLWSAMKGGFNSTARGSVAVGLYNCNSSGSSCTVIATSTRKPTGSWSGGSNTWVGKDWNLEVPSTTTISVGRVLQVRVAVNGDSGDDMWFAYDTTTLRSQLVVSS